MGCKDRYLLRQLHCCFPDRDVLVFPEAKDRIYQELDELFEKGTSARRFARTKTAHQAELESRV